MNELNSKEHETQYMFKKVAELGCGIFMVLETNVNFHNAVAKSQFFNLGLKHWKCHY